MRVSHVARTYRRPGQPRRRLPGRLAGRDLRGAASRGRPHPHRRGRADRLPRRPARPDPGVRRRLHRGRARYRGLVAAGGGVLPGESQLAGFVALKPEAEIRKQLALLSRLDDPEHVERFRAFEDWFKWTEPLAGRLYLWIVERLFGDNALVRGDLEIGGRSVDIGRIACPLYLLAGADDHITRPSSASRWRGTW